MMTQSELFSGPYNEPVFCAGNETRCIGKPTTARQDDENAAQIESFLRYAGTWVSAAGITAQLGINDRAIRAAAAASDGRIISGQAGYKLTANATAAEIAAFTGPMRSQAAKMLARACEAEAAWGRAI
jgi:hypothetical protein